MLALEGRAQPGELVADPPGHFLAAVGRGGDAERRQQRGGGRSGIAGLTEHRVQSLVGQVPKDKVDDAPRVVGLFAPVHEASTRRPDLIWHLMLRQWPAGVARVEL